MLTLVCVHGTVSKCLPGDVFMELYLSAYLGMCSWNCIKVLTWGCVHGTASKCLPGDVFMELYLKCLLGDVFNELILSANLGMCSWSCILVLTWGCVHGTVSKY